jgi:hypothetical protein
LTRGVCASWQQSHSVSVPAPASQPRRRFQSPDVTSASSWTSAQAALSPLGRTEPCHGRRAASRNRAECASHAISQGTQRTWSYARPKMPLEPGARFDAYEIVRPLASSGRGKVWLAKGGARAQGCPTVLPADLTRVSSRRQHRGAYGQSTSSGGHFRRSSH